MAEDTAGTVEATKEEAADARVTAPKTVADMEALTELKTTEASTSFCNFLNKHINVPGFEINEQQAWTVLYGHRVWQQSDERKAEIAAGKEAKEAEKAKRALEREAKKAENEKKAAEKKAEKERKEAEKKAKEAADADSDDDLDSADAETSEPASGEGEIAAPAKKARRPRGGKSAEGF